MPLSVPQVWLTFGSIAHVLGAIASVAVALWLMRRRDRLGPATAAIIPALLLTAGWCIVFASTGHITAATSVAETLRNLAWLLVIYRLFASDGRHESLAPIRPVVFSLAFVELVTLTIGLSVDRIALEPEALEIAFDFLSMFRLLETVGVLVLVHNLYAGASGHSQASLRWPATGLAILWTFDLNLYTIAYLGNGWPLEIAASRGLAAIALSALIAIGASKNRNALRFRPSRAVTFQTFSLLVIGIYLVAMVAVAQWLSYAGGDFARLMEVGFLTVASAAALLLLPSKRLRGWLRVTLAKHFFQHRYDYREEWLRFTRTIGTGGSQALPLGERVVQSVADIAECPAGLLLAPDDAGSFTLAARWNWPEIEVPAEAMSPAAVLYFERNGYIADLDDVRAGTSAGFDVSLVPSWIKDHPRVWALIPLIHYERLVGVVVLARPPVPRKLDWEDFDLLRVVGQQLASYLAENSGQLALAEASRFDDFNRRIAFVMHDIKNLASQLSLLARNAELHAEKKEFRDDMLVTLRNSADKLNTLIARLSRYGTGGIERLDQVAAVDVARNVISHFSATGQAVLTECEELSVLADAESLEQVLVHLVQNGIDASPDGRPVFMALTADGLNARFEVVDSGSGMSPEFVRNKLFKPFVSTKQGGFGIGAFEARELVQAMHGRLEVESREGTWLALCRLHPARLCGWHLRKPEQFRSKGGIMTEAKPKLLVVEDDPGLQAQLKWAYEDFEVIVAEDRPSALAALRSEAPEVVTLDLGLPPDPDGTTEGFAVLDEIMALKPDTKVIVASGHGAHESALQAIAKGAYDFYQKPVDIDAIGLIVRRAFQLRELEEENRNLAAKAEKGDKVLGRLITAAPEMVRVAPYNRARGQYQRLGNAAGRKRNRQGIAGPRLARRERPQRRRFCRHQLRRDPGKPARIRIVRSRKGRIHRRREDHRGQDRASRRRHAFPRRSG